LRGEPLPKWSGAEAIDGIYSDPKFPHLYHKGL
jgi:hypothetical protein